MMNTQTHAFLMKLIASQGGTITDCMNSDVECALMNLRGYPVEGRTMTLVLSLMKNLEARLALSSLQDNNQRHLFS